MNIENRILNLNILKLKYELLREGEKKKEGG